MPLFGQSQPKVPVLEALYRHPGVVAAGGHDRVAPHEGRGEDRILPEKRWQIAPLGLPLPFFIAEGTEPARHERDGRVAVEDGHGLFEVRGLEPIVRIERAEIGAGRIGDRKIARGGDAAVRRANHAGSVPAVVGEQALGRRVRRAVVYDDDFKVLIGLCKDTFDRLVEVMTEVVTGDDHRNGWRRGPGG